MQFLSTVRVRVGVHEVRVRVIGLGSELRVRDRARSRSRFRFRFRFRFRVRVTLVPVESCSVDILVFGVHEVRLLLARVGEDDAVRLRSHGQRAIAEEKSCRG